MTDENNFRPWLLMLCNGVQVNMTSFNDSNDRRINNLRLIQREYSKTKAKHFLFVHIKISWILYFRPACHNIFC